MLRYLHRLAENFGQAWNQYWFRPSDPATAAVLRIAVGTLAFYSIFTFSFDLERLFGPEGILSPAVVNELLVARNPQDARWRFSFLDALDNRAELWTFHVLSLVVLAMFTAGLWSRITSVLSAVVVLSYLHRGIFFSSEFETVIVFMLLYLCIAPSGARWSIDRLVRNRRVTAEPPRPSSAATVSIRLIQIHLTVVYVMMALGQLSNPVWWNGQAAWWLIANPQDTLFDLTWLASHPYLVNAWTHAIVVFELLFPWLVRKPLLRPLMLGLSVLVWASMAVLTGLVSFCLLMMAAGLAFVPGEALAAAVRGPRDVEIGAAPRTPAAKQPARVG